MMINAKNAQGGHHQVNAERDEDVHTDTRGKASSGTTKKKKKMPASKWLICKASTGWFFGHCLLAVARHAKFVE